MSETFCQVCRHRSPGHEANCPVGTGEPVRGTPLPYGINQDMQYAQQVQGQLGSMAGVSDVWPTSHTPCGYTDIDPRILVELQDIRAEIRALREEVLRKYLDESEVRALRGLLSQTA